MFAQIIESENEQMNEYLIQNLRQEALVWTDKHAIDSVNKLK